MMGVMKQLVTALLLIALLPAQEAPLIGNIVDDGFGRKVDVYAWTDLAKKKEFLVFVSPNGTGGFNVSVVPRIERDPPPPKPKLPAEAPLPVAATATGARP
jgi:hypothetical protein